jgi:hypothetical protein
MPSSTGGLGFAAGLGTAGFGTSALGGCEVGAIAWGAAGLGATGSGVEIGGVVTLAGAFIVVAASTFGAAAFGFGGVFAFVAGFGATAAGLSAIGCGFGSITVGAVDALAFALGLADVFLAGNFLAGASVAGLALLEAFFGAAVWVVGDLGAIFAFTVLFASSALTFSSFAFSVANWCSSAAMGLLATFFSIFAAFSVFAANGFDADFLAGDFFLLAISVNPERKCGG